jgi:hypothetical protein
MNQVFIITMEDALLEVPLQRIIDNKVYSNIQDAVKSLESILDSLPDNGMNNEEHFKIESIELI